MRKDFLESLTSLINKNNSIPLELYEELDVKRGLRNKNGTGVLVGLTKIGSVHGYRIENGVKIPEDGRLYYRGIELSNLISEFDKERRFSFEKTMFLLLFGKIPTSFELNFFTDLLKDLHSLPDEFVENFILRKPSMDVMNQLQRNILCLYTIDDNPDNTDLKNLIDQTLNIIAKFPSLLVYSYQACMHKHFNKSLVIHNPIENYSMAENILHMLRNDNSFTQIEAETLDLILVIHAEHGGGNNSTFTSHVVSSTETDTYSTISASIGSLKGPKHGGANYMVGKMIENIKSNIDYKNEEQLKNYIYKLFKKEVFDKKGLVYGMGHAIYTLSDPRAEVLKEKAYQLALEKDALDEYNLYTNIEKFTKQISKELKGSDFAICANVDLYSGFVYKLLGIPNSIFTPLFALSRIASWNAHRIEQLTSERKIIRPAYKAVDKDGKLIL